MTVFESKATINQSPEQVYQFLSDMNNHQKLMPDSISNWSSTNDEASFTIQNMGNLALKVSNRIENSAVIIVPSQPAPFGIEIRWTLSPGSDNSTIAILSLSAELNMMMKMLASGPLQKLTDHQVKQLATMFK